MVGRSESASSGRISQADFQSRPFTRGADIVDMVPNLFSNEHAGGGKATEFFLRGVPMFHGTDFSIFAEGVPLNLPSHAHGQGYIDINWVIPELIDYQVFRKGPYYADVGDFSTVGTLSMEFIRKLDRPFVKMEAGSYDYYRVVNAASSELWGGDLLYGMEGRFYNGPWVEHERLRKFSGMLKWTKGDEETGFAASGFAYNNQWTNTNQIPERLITELDQSRFTTISPTDGGNTNRYGVNFRGWHTHDNDAVTRANVYCNYYDLQLFANYTGFLDDESNQIRQGDYRIYQGTQIDHTWYTDVMGEEVRHKAGFWFRNDVMPLIALDSVDDRRFIDVIRRDRIVETSIALFYENEIMWLEKLRTVQGIRGDVYNFDVHADTLPQNSGNVWWAEPQPKFSAIFGPWSDTELFYNYGMGFHSNDARGVTQSALIDEETGLVVAASPVPGLVQTYGMEWGARNSSIEGLNLAVAGYYLHMGSELLFEGDEGATLPTAATDRWGVELNAWYALTDWCFIEAEWSATKSRYSSLFEDFGPEGTDTAGFYVPTAPNQVFALVNTLQWTDKIFTTLQYRFFGSRPLTPDNSVRSEPTNTLNARIGYQGKQLAFGLDLLNITNSKDPAISYYYRTRLQGEPADGVLGRVIHPLLPFEMRAYVSYSY